MVKYKVERVLIRYVGEDGQRRERYAFRIYKKKFFLWFFQAERANYGLVKCWFGNKDIKEWIHVERI